jgi:hypothetical protein
MYTRILHDFSYLYENQQHRNNIVPTYIARTCLFSQCAYRCRLGDWYSVRRLAGAASSLFDWDNYKLDVRRSITRGKWLFAGQPLFDSRPGHIFCFSPQLQSCSGLIHLLTQLSLFSRAYNKMTIRPGFSGTCRNQTRS